VGWCEPDWSDARSVDGFVPDWWDTWWMDGCELDWSDARSVGGCELDLWSDISWNLFIIFSNRFQLRFILSSDLFVCFSCRFQLLFILSSDLSNCSSSRFRLLADVCSNSVIDAWSLALSFVFALKMMSCSSDLLTFCW
jgi:hypothetical protein